MILFKKVLRLSDPTDQDSVKRVYPIVTYKYSQAATLGECAKEISGNSGVSEGETISVLKDFRAWLKKQLLAGRAVNIDGLGYFYLAISSKGAENAEDFTVADISGVRVCFRANNDIRLHTGTTTRTDGLTFRDVDKVNNPGSGSDDDDIIDPMV